MSQDIRPGEEQLPFDPADRTEAGLSFIGAIRSPWSKGDCPRNIARARESGKGARIELRPGYGRGLLGLSVGQPVIAVYWMDRARRDLIVQSPGHADGPRGTFALRSPVRPNSLAMAVVVITSLDAGAGVIGIDAIDVFDGTPLVDLKPWLSTVDIPPGWTPEA
ncbi:TrmO family methyltransferase [Poseidonocella sp. HB161398]|uniref:TrmO family methyltransferase domain-containing protein n=1 Tax=Poseidonocella sp. HB161398 TaxID=2320855 RepID=UPI00110818A7|nr:TrmO family methyltransferase [Poseidonocella sp. HB161398]